MLNGRFFVYRWIYNLNTCHFSKTTTIKIVYQISRNAVVCKA